jgi:hypothetical protein
MTSKRGKVRPRPMPRRSLTLLLVALAALVVGACGNKEARTLHADTEGVYVDVGALSYQVQISRLLNPANAEDHGYLIDLPAGQRLGPSDQWFGVFMRVENGSHAAQRAADRYEIVDTQDNVYRPIQMGPKNVFAYRAETIGANQTLPLPDSPSGQNSIQGALLLFKIPVANFENRPLELRISPPAGTSSPVGTVDLDI